MIVLNDQQTLMDKYATLSLRYNIGSDGAVLAGLNASLQGQSAGSDLENKTGVSADQLKALAEKIKSAGKVCVIYNPTELVTGAAGIAPTVVSASPPAVARHCFNVWTEDPVNAAGL